MTVNVQKSRTKSSLAATSALTSQETLEELRSNEVFVGIVGPAGSGSGTAAEALKLNFEEEQFEVDMISASSLIRSAALCYGLDLPTETRRKALDDVLMLQDRGDELRKGTKYEQKRRPLSSSANGAK